MPRITNVPKKSKSSKTKKSTFIPTSLDNYTEVRGKLIGPSLRPLLPKKSELVDRQGRLKVSKSTLDDLFSAIDKLRVKGVQKERDSQGRFKKTEDLGLDKMIDAIRNDPHLSRDERTQAAAAAILRKTLDPGVARQAQNIAKSSGAIRNKDWYSAKHFVEDLDDETGAIILDISRLTEAQKEQIKKGIEDGTMNVGSLPEEVLRKLMGELYDTTDDWQETKDEHGKHGQLLDVSPQMREREMAGISDILRRFA